MTTDLKDVQKVLSYKFRNADLLLQAFIRRSYSQENGGENNEVLEFIGDKALDLVVIRIMMKRFGHIIDVDVSPLKESTRFFKTDLSEGMFTEIKKELVEKSSLAGYMNQLGFQRYLMMGKGDLKTNVQNQDSVKEDLFEAILGAVTLDCGWNLDIITKVAKRMIDFDEFFKSGESENRNYVGMVQEWSQRKGYGLPMYEYHWRDNSSCNCHLRIQGIDMEGVGLGTSEAKARMGAAKKFYQLLGDQGFLCFNKYKEEIGTPDPIRSVAQINELIQKNLLGKVSYEFEDSFDRNGNPIWTCTLKMDGINKVISHSGSSKKQVQRECAYEMLVFLMETEK